MIGKMKKLMNDVTNCDLKVGIGDAQSSCHQCILAQNEYFSALSNPKLLFLILKQGLLFEKTKEDERNL